MGFTNGGRGGGRGGIGWDLLMGVGGMDGIY